MAIKNIQQLPGNTDVTDDDMFAIYHGSDTYNITYKALVDKLKEDGLGGDGDIFGEFDYNANVIALTENKDYIIPFDALVIAKRAPLVNLYITYPGGSKFLMTHERQRLCQAAGAAGATDSGGYRRFRIPAGTHLDTRNIRYMSSNYIYILPSSSYQISMTSFILDKDCSKDDKVNITPDGSVYYKLIKAYNEFTETYYYWDYIFNNSGHTIKILVPKTWVKCTNISGVDIAKTMWVSSGTHKLLCHNSYKNRLFSLTPLTINYFISEL